MGSNKKVKKIVRKVLDDPLTKEYLLKQKKLAKEYLRKIEKRLSDMAKKSLK